MDERLTRTPQVGEVLIGRFYLPLPCGPGMGMVPYCVYVLPHTARDATVPHIEECFACLVISPEQPFWIGWQGHQFNRRAHRNIRRWVLTRWSEPARRRTNTIGSSHRRVPGYSQGIIVEPPSTIHWSCLRPLVPYNPRFRFRFNPRSIPVPFHLLQYLDPQDIDSRHLSGAVVEESDDDTATQSSTSREGSPELGVSTDPSSAENTDDDLEMAQSRPA